MLLLDFTGRGESDGDVITFTMKPGPRAKLTRVEVHGNVKVPDEVLVQGMKHAPAGLWVRLVGFNPLAVLQKDAGGYYNPIYLEEDTRALVHNYELEGFFEARVNGALASGVRNDKPFLKLAGLGGGAAEEVWLAFHVEEFFWDAILGSLVITFVSMILGFFNPRD